MPKIEQLTLEQEAVLKLYRNKWKAIAFSTQPIKEEKAANAIKAAYKFIGVEEPKIIFSPSPYAALNAIVTQIDLPNPQQELGKQWQQLTSQLINQIGNPLMIELGNQIAISQENQLYEQLDQQLGKKLYEQLSEPIEKSGLLWSEPITLFAERLYQQLVNQMRHRLNVLKFLPEYFTWLRLSIVSARFTDFCISILNCDFNPQAWELFQLLINECGWIYPFEKTCFVCYRPIQIIFDSEGRLHALGEPAIQFADGYSLYAYHGVILSQEYGKVHPNLWQAHWLLKEDNAEVRRVLIQGIGYERICEDLGANELDNWQEYQLLEIDNVDVEPIHLLRMTCPSTDYLHILRVPPDVCSAREAIKWVNWGIDPLEFSVQT